MEALSRNLTRLAALASILAIAVWLAVAVSRASYPFELEWQEGGMLAHVRRVRAGEALFVAPTLEFAPFPYPPLFAWCAAGMASLLGEQGFLALRLVSVLATCATLVLLFDLVRRETGRSAAGLVAAGLYAAAFRWGGAWFDVGRVDALALALAVGAWHRARAGGAAGAGLLTVAAGLAKQTTFALTLPLAFLFLARSRREALLFLGVALAGSGLAFGALHVASDGVSTWTLFTLLADHPWYSPKVLGFWTEDVVRLAPMIVAGGFLARRELRRWGAPLAGAFLAAWVGRAHVGGYDNTLLPAALAGAVLAGLALGRGRGFVAVLALTQFALFAYDPRDQLPTAADREAGERVVAALGRVEGEVFAPYQGYLAVRAGKRDSVHAMALFDLSASEQVEERERVVALLRAALADGHYAAVLLAEREPFEGLLGPGWRLEPPLLGPGELLPVTGEERAPARLHVRR